MLDGGGTLMVEGDGVNFAAAGHSEVIVSGDTIYHFYHAYGQRDGGAELRIVEMPFDDEGWPASCWPPSTIRSGPRAFKPPGISPPLL